VNSQIIADLPTLPIPKGNAGAGFLAHIRISKFVDHLPFYRQSGPDTLPAIFMYKTKCM